MEIANFEAGNAEEIRFSAFEMVHVGLNRLMVRSTVGASRFESEEAVRLPSRNKYF